MKIKGMAAMKAMVRPKNTMAKPRDASANRLDDQRDYGNAKRTPPFVETYP